MAQHNDIGRQGEKLVAEYLTARGYAIAEQNWRSGHLEVDIIATKDDEIAFVEVKTRNDDFVDPLDAVDSRKIRHMVASANAFMQTCDIDLQPRFDVAAVVLHAGEPSKAPTIEYIEDAFLPPLR